MTRLFAYIDPGTGSFVVQALIGGVLGGLYLVRTHIKGLFGYFKRGKKAEDD